MKPINFSLIALNDDVSEKAFLSSISKLPMEDRPLYVGKCHHWIHAPNLSARALTGAGPEVKKWDHLLIYKAATPGELKLPGAITSQVAESWTLNAPVDDAMILGPGEASLALRATTPPALPSGWSPQDHSGLDAAEPPSDLEASLALSSYPLGSRTDGHQKPIGLKDFTRDFGTSHPGPIAMFNLLAYHPDGRIRYFEYIKAFVASVGSRYGGTPLFHGQEVVDWSSRASEAEDKSAKLTGEWVDTALVWYPSIWHFSKMLDDPDYADVDRKFKQGALKDNPLICCTEIDVTYEG